MSALLRLESRTQQYATVEVEIQNFSIKAADGLVRVKLPRNRDLEQRTPDHQQQATELFTVKDLQAMIAFAKANGVEE